MMQKRWNKFFGEIFFSYFPEGKIKNILKCFIANKYLFRNSDFNTTYKNDIFIESTEKMSTNSVTIPLAIFMKF